MDGDIASRASHIPADRIVAISGVNIPGGQPTAGNGGGIVDLGTLPLTDSAANYDHNGRTWHEAAGPSIIVRALARQQLTGWRLIAYLAD